jgi:putative flippase GtrA
VARRFKPGIAGNVRFVRFLVTGGIAAAANLVARYVLNFAVSFEVAVVLAFAIGMLTAYFLARAFVFDAPAHGTRVQIARFAAVNAGALVIVWSVSVGLARVLFPAIGFTWHAVDIAHLIGVSSTAVTSYLAHKHWSFARAP